MAQRFQDYEDRQQRRTWRETDGTAYRRVYNVPLQVVAVEVPAEGDPMPGEDAALLGPFVEKGGITFGQQQAGAMQQVILKCKLLKARS